jgi:small subunit ribosomal protein S6
MGVTVLAKKTAVYEGMFILDSNRLARDREGLPREVTGAIEEAGGQMELSRLWEERRLAYPIKGQRKGSYWITYFRIDTSAIAELNRHFEIADGILRHLIIRLPDSLVEPILEHAKGEKVRPARQIEVEADDEEEEEAEVVDAVEATAS